jgi:hypothetical protein
MERGGAYAAPLLMIMVTRYKEQLDGGGVLSSTMRGELR